MKKTILKSLAVAVVLLCGLTANAETYGWCHDTNDKLHRSYGDAYLTWTTTAAGDVVITIDNATFRAGGFENKGSWEASWNVLSGENLATSVSASTYFNEGSMSEDNTTYTITKKEDVTLPEGAVLQFAGHAFSWKATDEEGKSHDEYFLNPDLKYTYGLDCSALDAPTNVAVTEAGVLTFTEVEGAEKYIANFYDGVTLVGSKEVTSGATLTFLSSVNVTLTVKVLARAAGRTDSPESVGATWNVKAIALPESKFCTTLADAITANNGYCSPLFTIQTTAEGNVTIVLSAGEGEDGQTMFRGNGMKIENFKLNNSAEAFAAAFTVAKTDDYTITLTLTENAQIANGDVISYAGMIEAKSSLHNNDWSTYQLDGYIYGTQCPTDVAVKGVTLDQTEVSLPNNKTLTLTAKVAPANAENKEVTWQSSNTNVATVVDGVVTPVAETGTTTITVTTVEGGFTATCVVTLVEANYTEPNVAAPKPAHAAGNVVSIYSDAYTPAIPNLAPSMEFAPPAPTMERATIDGDEYLHYYGTMTGGIGWEFHQKVNVSEMTNLHVDIWPSVDGSIDLNLLKFKAATEEGESATDVTITLTVEKEKWNSINIDLSEYAKQKAEFSQITWKHYTGQSEISIDNFYFWKQGTTTLVDANEVFPKVVKAIENGQVVIIRDGVRYNVMGNVIR